jgi:hypothetical protein
MLPNWQLYQGFKVYFCKIIVQLIVIYLKGLDLGDRDLQIGVK